MISFNDYTKIDGSTDWQAYRDAQVKAGERCYQCTAYTSPFGRGSQTLCTDCKDAESNQGEISHSSRIRCPFCKRMMDAHNLEIFSEGDHGVTCFDCEKDFYVNSEIIFTFVSPALGKSGKEDDE